MCAAGRTLGSSSSVPTVAHELIIVVPEALGV